MVLACDVKILKLRDMDAREEKDVAQSDADYAECVDIVRCVLSNKVALHRRCPLKVCIRARTCAGKASRSSMGRFGSSRLTTAAIADVACPMSPAVRT